jgi:HTH-type transcriptional repressor of NAD biosynthesis genes
MKKGFILGKFYPFHAGHEALMRKALAQCDQLTVLVTKAESENISGELRAAWIAATFVDEPRLKVKLLHYDERVLANSSVASRDVSKVWAAKLKEIFPEEQIIFTCEEYGDFVAEYMGIQHIFIPQQGEVRATLVRQNPYKMWASIPAMVKPYYQRKVVILGTESVGKTTMSEYLARHFSASLVEEAGRTFVPTSAKFELKDLETVAEAHAENIIQAAAELRPLIIIDTDLNITASYARFAFGVDLEFSPALWAANQADLYLYLVADLPFEQDGTRMDEAARNRLDFCHRLLLREKNIEFVEISGQGEARFLQAVGAIENHFEHIGDYMPQ